MDILIEEAPQLLISLVLIIATTILLVSRVATVLEGMPLLVLVAGYWVGNGASRYTATKLASQAAPPSDPKQNIVPNTTPPASQ